ncbi:MAG: methylmalonyl Co-A mutase-associated GTPase MeaB [Flavobacteriales bacterium]|nr:methylmalonyl Co-A mutase-associated GTPase MeaB [Flavobacteriales bacterium]
MNKKDIETLFEKLCNGDRLALSRCITLIESKLPEHQKIAEILIRKCLSLKKQTLRIGVTGVPGVGKSTFINDLGVWLLEHKSKKIAVLAIDPSSNSSHGSVLGDKTRMDDLSKNERVFIRPTPAGGHLGGIGRKTLESILLCEASGFDTIIVETVGVGQSEYLADQVVDCLVLLVLPNSGDELQGIKRGIMELADLLIVNKEDTSNLKQVKECIRDLKNAVSLLSAKNKEHSAPVLTNRMANPETVSKIWDEIENFMIRQKKKGYFDKKRIQQYEDWMSESLQQRLSSKLFESDNFRNYSKDYAEKWKNEEITIDEILNHLIKNSSF